MSAPTMTRTQKLGLAALLLLGALVLYATWSRGCRVGMPPDQYYARGCDAQ